MSKSALTKRTTVYLDASVKRYLQHEAIYKESSMSRLINDKFTEEATAYAKILDEVIIFAPPPEDSQSE